MRAYEVATDGEGLDKLRLVDRPDPEPGPGQALIGMRAASLNYRDQIMVKGGYHTPAPGPVIPLSDGAGEVIAVGPGVSRVKPGDRVAPTFFQTWIDGRPPKRFAALGSPLDGVLAEKMLVHEDGLVAIPDWLSFEGAACLPCAALTAWNALYGVGKPLITGQTVLVQGSGGVSMFALQFAKAAGARVIATTSSNAKAQRIRALGADEVVNYKTTPDWENEVQRLTGGEEAKTPDGRTAVTGGGVDVVVEVGGAGTLPKSYAALGWGGKISLIGVMTQTENPAQLNPIGMAFKNGSLHGVMVGCRRMFEDMLKAMSANDIRPLVDRVFAFEDARGAYETAMAGDFVGKVVIRIP
jgi:NADPH:quinone reductase-like Zn-dependent oxidoreductase